MSFNDLKPSVETVKQDTFLSVLREALGGTERDFTKGSIPLALTILAIPMILEMSMEALFAIVDTFFVAKLGAAPVAVVGLTESVLALIYAVAIGLSIGATATVARRFGEKDFDGAARAATHVVYLGLFVSILMGIIGLIFAPQIYSLLGADEEVLNIGLPFMRIMLGTNAVIVFLFVLNGIFRGVGDAAIALRVLVIANGLNIILNPLLIFGVWIFPEMGVTGSALSTVIGRGSGVAYAAWALFGRNNGRLEVRREHWKFDPELLWSLTRLSSTAVLQLLVTTATWSVLIRIIAVFGSVAIAGYQIGLRIFVFLLLPVVGLANAAAALVGQNLGAGESERAERSVWIAGATAAALLGTVGLFFVLFAESLVSIFTTDQQVAAYASDCLRIIGYGYAFYGLAMVTESSFNGAGDVWTPTYINIAVLWVLEIPLAYVLATGYGMGPQGVFWAISISFTIWTVVAVAVFRRGKWKQKTI